ncbi:tetratricopeptide repeat protein [Fontimonas sp. SYSU GA230001]
MALAAAITLGGCTPQVVKESAPAISKTIGRLEQPSVDVLPIIRSEPIAADPEKALENYRKLLELAPDPATRAEAERRLADLQVQMEDARGVTETSEKSLREALALYQKLLKSDPLSKDNDRIYYQMARAQQNLGETDAAIDTLQRLTQKHPDSRLVGDARFRRAELLFYRSRYAEAEVEYKAVMDLKDATPFFESAQYKYGWSQYKQSKYEESIATFLVILDNNLPGGELLIEPEPALERVARSRADLVRDSLRVITLSLASLGGGPALNDYLAAHGDPRFYPLIYVALGQALLDRERYTDAAGAYAAFIQRYPASPLAPGFQMRVIAAHEAGGFRDLVVQEKERYATTYDPAAPYWNGQPATAEVMAQLRKTIEDLARHYHARAQQDTAQGRPAQNQADFLLAARWYRRIIELYPKDEQLPDVNFLLGDALLDGGRTLDAALEYDRTAYGYPAHRRAGEAAQAAVLAYQKHATEVPAEQRPAALQSAIDASLKLADSFPGHPQKYPVLTQAAQDLFELKDYDRAIAVAERVLKADRTVDGRLRRIAWSVTGDAHFAQARYPQAETAFAEELKLTSPKSAERAQIVEQLAASIYKQGEGARAANDLKTAAFHFLRVGQAAPDSKIRATAEYDGAAALIALQDWGGAARVLEGFRKLFPGHPLEADVDKKLAVAYQKDNKPLDAARAYARIAGRGSETVDVRREAAWLSATLFDEGKSTAEAEAAYETYVRNFPRPLDRALDARARLVEYARASGNTPRLSQWLRELVTADETAGGERSPRSKALAAQSSLDLGRMAADDTRAQRLTLPIERSLPRKKQAMEEAIRWLGKAAGYGFAETTTAATYELGVVYRDFGKALLESERPRKLSALELEQYDLLLEEQAYPFEEQAIQTHETNLRRIATGTYDLWIARSAQALAELVPARYGKREQGEERYETLD